MKINKSLISSFAKATQKGAYGASLLVGKNDKIAADKAAVDEMRNELNKIDIKGSIVIGEGEMDEAPMLFINEKVGTNNGEEFDIAVDPLEGTNFAAKNLPNALSVLAVARKGNLLRAPDMYMEKIAIGKNVVLEGRDIGTIVFPDADYKFFLIADIYERARRRLKENDAKEDLITLYNMVLEIQNRDKNDSSREHSPLKKARDAIEIDTTNLHFEDQVQCIVETVKKSIT